MSESEKCTGKKHLKNGSQVVIRVGQKINSIEFNGFRNQLKHTWTLIVFVTSVEAPCPAGWPRKRPSCVSFELHDPRGLDTVGNFLGHYWFDDGWH